MAVKIIFFNHKGGVSKTTSTYNIGWMLGILGKRVLLVDADSQCNLSGLILGDNFDSYYLDDNTRTQNIKDGVSVAFEARPNPISSVSCFSPATNPNVFLLAGHADLSEYDAALSFAQMSNNAIATLQNLPGAFNELIEKTAERYNIDFVLIDLNPGLSAINQNLFVSSDAFIIPTNPDPFSIMALNTLQNILPRWVRWADQIRPLFANSSYPMPNTKPKFMGEIIQRFNIRKGKAARPYRDNISDIKNKITNDFVPAIGIQQMLFSIDAYNTTFIENGYCLSEIPNFQGLLSKANDAVIPVFALTPEQIAETGVVLQGLIDKRDDFYSLFEGIANQIINMSAYANRN